MSSYPTDYSALPPGVVLDPHQQALYTKTRIRAARDGSDCLDALRDLRFETAASLVNVRAVADALGGPGCGERDFPC